MSELETGIKALRGLRKARRKPMTLSREDVVEQSYLKSGATLPLVIQPKLAGADLADWAARNPVFLERESHRHGGILFRGFKVHTMPVFERFLGKVCPRLMHYVEGATPRTKLSEKVYTSTEFPPDRAIELHNELSYVITWPMKIWFCCFEPPGQGGATPIADVRRVYHRIDPAIRESFERKGWMLVRNFGDGFGLPWQKSFGAKTREALEAYCREADITCEWRGNNRLRTRQVRPATATHPQTGETVWFNHIAFWHISSLEPQLRALFANELKDDEVPFNCFYGDGTPIDEEVVDALRSAYRQETVVFPWQRGDVLMLDNMLVAHGRQPYLGKRKILAAMGEPYGPGLQNGVEG